MIFGIQKRQWLLILLALSVPLTLNIIAILQRVGLDAILQMLRGSYIYVPYYIDSLYLDHNPFLEIFLNILPIVIFLGLLAWFMVFISSRAFFQKQSLVANLFEAILMSSFVAVIFDITSGFFMPLTWIPVFYNTLGMPGSSFMFKWSRWLVLPATAIILFVAILFSRIRSFPSHEQNGANPALS